MDIDWICSWATIQEDLIKFRVKHGITQATLAKKTGLSKTTIIGIENGYIKKPQAVTINRLHTYFKTMSESKE